MREPVGAPFRGMARALLLVLVSLLVLECDDVTGPSDGGSIDIGELFWRAYQDPAAFDAWLATQRVDAQTTSCVRTQYQNTLRASQDKARECAQMVQGSLLWEGCWDDQERLNDSAVLLRDLALALEGTKRFAETEFGQYLILAKSVVGEEQWNSGLAILRDLLSKYPPLECPRADSPGSPGSCK